MTDWISVKDRLPDVDGVYLVWVLVPTLPDNALGEISYVYHRQIKRYSAQCRSFMHSAISRANHITHWMPLPDPPEAEEE